MTPTTKTNGRKRASGAAAALAASEMLSARSVAKRRGILGAAWGLFSEHGFDSTGMRELASEAGVSTATIYAHFPTKRDLLRALIEERWKAALGRMLRRASRIDDPLERLISAVTDLNRAIAADPLLRQLLVAPHRSDDPVFEQKVGPIEDMMDSRCSEAIAIAVAAGRFVCEDPQALAVLIRVSMQGWLLTEAKRRKPMSEERVTRALMTLIRSAGTPIRKRH